MIRLWLQIVGLVGVRVYNLGAILRSLRRAIQVSIARMDRSPLSTHPIPIFVWILQIYVPLRPVLDQWRGIQT